MASELTVQTIKAPTSGGNANKILIGSGQILHAPGHVIQVKNDTSTTAVVNSSQAYTDMGLSVIITPNSATNYFWVMFEGHFSSGNTTSSKGYGFNIHKNGTAVTGSPNDGVNPSDAPYDFYMDNASNRFFRRDSKIYYAATGTTSAVTFTAQFTGYNYSSQGDVTLGMSNETQHTLTVMEIAG